MFDKEKYQPPAPYYQPQYPPYYPPPQQLIPQPPFGSLSPPYQHPQQPYITRHPNLPIQQTAPRNWFKIFKKEVRNLANDQPILTISRQSAHNIPDGLSSKSSLALTRPDGSLMGTIRFHSMTSTDIDFTVNGHSSKLSDPYMMGDKFTFKPISRGAVTTFGLSGEKWCWKLKGGNAALHSAKKGGDLLAKVDDGMLVFEKQGMSHAEMDEIMVTAVAVFNKGRRNKKDGEAAEGIFEVVGAFAGA